MYGTLVIRPINAHLTRNTDLFSKMDPYVKVILGSQKRQTSVARNAGKHPQWRDEFIIKYNSQDDIIKFEVWDEDTGKRDDFVGSGALAIATIQQKGNRTQESVQLSYKGRDAGTLLVDITLTPDNMMKQQNMMIPNQFMQASPQGTFPMMMQNQGMIPQQIPQYQQQTTYYQQQPNLTQQIMYPNQGMIPQQIPQYQQQTTYYQQQPNLTQQNMYQNQGMIPQQMQMQQGYPQQIQQMPVQQTYAQQQPMKKVDNFAPPIEQANTFNKNQLRPGTQIYQNQGGMMYPQGNPNQYGQYYP